MGIFKQPIEDPTKPLEAAAELSSVDEPTADSAAIEDRSAYNCTNCQGEGLVIDLATKQYIKCPVCLGKGKVS